MCPAKLLSVAASGREWCVSGVWLSVGLCSFKGGRGGCVGEGNTIAMGGISPMFANCPRAVVNLPPPPARPPRGVPARPAPRPRAPAAWVGSREFVLKSPHVYVIVIIIERHDLFFNRYFAMRPPMQGARQRAPAGLRRRGGPGMRLKFRCDVDVMCGQSRGAMSHDGHVCHLGHPPLPLP